MNNEWYEYGEFNHDDSVAEAGHLHTYMYDLDNSNSYSGFAKDFTITEPSKFTFSADFHAYQGGNGHYAFHIFKRGEPTSFRYYKYKLNLDEGNGLETRTMSTILDPGEYTFLIGRYNHSYEFWVKNDEMTISPASEINTDITHTRSVWDWIGTPDDSDELIQICKQLRIDCLYYWTGHTNIVSTNIQLIDMINKLEQNNIDFYFAMGHPKWYNDLETIYERQQLVVNFIKETNCKVQGICYDIESYSPDLDTETGPDKHERIATYANNLLEVYQNNRACNLKTIVAIPTWCHNNIIPTYVANCDGLTLMNYSTLGDTANRIKEEVEEAKKQNKWIETIGSLGTSEPEEESWYSKGLRALEDDFDNIKSSLNYDKLAVSYHHWEPLKKMYYEEGGIDMALFKPYKCLESQLEKLPVVDGQVIFTTDTKEIYMDDGTERKKYTPNVPDSTKVFVQDAQPETNKDGDVWMVVEN